jgi:hypothetical protein
MKLIYRATSFEYNPNQSRLGNTGRPVRPAQLSQSPYTLIYRGLTIHVDPKVPAAKAPALPPTYDLIYRGTTYHVTRDDQGVVTAVITPAGRTRGKTASVSPTFSQRRIGEVHRANLLNNLQRRLQAAQERGDQKLIDLLEAEWQKIAA